ncbi:hypothetical protein [Streptomyces angustmyceticus]|uniref:hypothetical protein n=1 Tax=Streptomyces angustmyceticus TaxID=285578 RepID=UPI00344EBF98
MNIEHPAISLLGEAHIGVEDSMIFEARARAGPSSGDAQRAPARAAWPPSPNSAVGRSDTAWIRA